MSNLLTEHKALHLKRRDVDHPFIPTLPEIFDLCLNANMVFADLIKRVLYNPTGLYQIDSKFVTYQAVTYDLFNDDALADLNALGQVEWSTEDVIEYITINTFNLLCTTKSPA